MSKKQTKEDYYDFEDLLQKTEYKKKWTKYALPAIAFLVIGYIVGKIYPTENPFEELTMFTKPEFLYNSMNFPFLIGCFISAFIGFYKGVIKMFKNMNMKLVDMLFAFVLIPSNLISVPIVIYFLIAYAVTSLIGILIIFILIVSSMRSKWWY